MLILCSLCSVVSQSWSQRAPSLPDAPWQPPAAVLKKYVPLVPHGEAELDATNAYTLGQLIDIAESNNPTTKEAWNHAKASAAAVGIAKSELYPTLFAFATGNNYNTPPLLYNTFVVQDIGLFAAAVHLDYTLVDFGARRSEITAAQAKLVAANLSFNDTHLQLIQQVSQAYYALLNARGLRIAAEVNLRDAEALDEAAQERRNNGLATLPDILEARGRKRKGQLRSAERDWRREDRFRKSSDGCRCTHLLVPSRFRHLMTCTFPILWINRWKMRLKTPSSNALTFWPKGQRPRLHRPK